MMPSYRHRPLAWMSVLALIAGLAPSLFSQERSKTLTISRVETPPRIDGLVDDECWRGREPVSGFFQYDPVNGSKASEETYVWAAYDQNYVYFAFLMKDAQPDKIWAELTPRNEFDNNDSITLILDAYNDKRTSITFSLNPKGIQKNSVETIWKSEAAMRPDGWSAEMAIPFKSLRFSARENQVWGVNFERYIHRLNETDYWTDIDRDLPKLQQSGEIRGLAGVRPGYNLEFFPYAGVRTSTWEDETDTKAAAGIDAKWGIKPNLYLDVTASPDFSEVESDPFIYQLSPYENYFQENRPFFTEGSRYFTLSSGDEYHGGGVSLFYSRRIRNPEFAAKISGKTGGFGFGILGALNKEEVGDSFFGVFRVQKDIFKNSQVGVYYAGIHDGVDRNQNVALDYNFNFGDFYYIRGMSAFTFNEGTPSARNGIHQLQFQREPDAGLQVMSGFQRVEDNVDIRTGYIDQVDVQSFDLMTGYAWRYNKGLLKRFSLDIGGTLRQDSHGNATGENMEFFFWTEFFNRIELHGGFEFGRSKYQVLDETDELAWTADFIKTYGGNLDLSWERGGFLKEVGVEAGWEKRGVYNEEFTAVVPGSQTSVEGQLVLRPRSNLEWSVEGGWIRQTIDGTGAEAFSGLAYETALHYQLTRSLFLNTRFLGETRENQYSLDFLVGYYFGAGNIVQLSFKKSERNELLGRVGGYSITLKVSYLLRI
ncbi:MAG: hypothetical protein A2Y86_05150 [Candidatus Aminicenantes bacterium RBG_13_62_12]|nr:MAG: hypothetical protein A2Y86_05150 [Candidatus Aminicenantes bacterium RBG_13_62_12]